MLDPAIYPCIMRSMAGNRSAFRMADRLAGGNLAEKIGEYRKVRAPWQAIADQLQKEYGVEVTPDTLRRWAIELGVERGPVATEATA